MHGNISITKFGLILLLLYAKIYNTISLTVLILTIIGQVVITIPYLNSTWYINYFAIVDYFAFGFFTLEIFLRYIIFPNGKLKFFLSPLNIIDLIAVTQYFIFLGINQTTSANTNSIASSFSTLIIFKIFRYFPSMKVN